MLLHDHKKFVNFAPGLGISSFLHRKIGDNIFSKLLILKGSCGG